MKAIVCYKQRGKVHAACLVENCKPSCPWTINSILEEREADAMQIPIAIIRYVDEHQPGFVECEFVDAMGMRHTFIEKAPVVAHCTINSQTTLPLPGSTVCRVVAWNADGSAEVEIDLAGGDIRARVRSDDLHD